MNRYQLIGEILSLGVEITERTDNDVFIDYSGHVNALDIRIYLGGWKEGAELTIRQYIYLEDMSIKHLEEIKQRLRDILDGTDIENFPKQYRLIEEVTQ